MGPFHAGVALGDDRLVEQAVELALRLPTEWPGPDVTHGRAGLGLTLLHFYSRTGQAVLSRRRTLRRLVAAAMSSAFGQPGRLADAAGFPVEFCRPHFLRVCSRHGRHWHVLAGHGKGHCSAGLSRCSECCRLIAGRCCTRRDQLIGGETGQTSLRFVAFVAFVAALVQWSFGHRFVLLEMVEGQPGRLLLPVSRVPPAR